MHGDGTGRIGPPQGVFCSDNVTLLYRAMEHKVGCSVLCFIFPLRPLFLVERQAMLLLIGFLTSMLFELAETGILLIGGARNTQYFLPISILCARADLKPSIPSRETRSERTTLY